MQQAFYCKDTQAHWERCVAHVDMLAFFPSCEQIDYPELQQKPVAVVNGDAGTTIISSSYEARAYGIKTGVRVNEAIKLCPELIVRPSRPERYAEISSIIMSAIYSIAPDMETFSIDECFIDLKPCLSLYKSVTVIADKIKQAIHETTQGIRCTIGISEGKLTAKYCGSTNKGGITIIPPNQNKDFIANAPIEKICGIGKSKTLFLKQHGIHHCKDVTPNTYHLFKNKHGTTGDRLYSICQGHDPEPVSTSEAKPQSIGHSKILPPNTTDFESVQGVLHQLAHRLARRLRAQELLVEAVTVSLTSYRGKIEKKYHFQSATNNSSAFIKAINTHLSLWQKTPIHQVSIHCDKLIEFDQIEADLFGYNTEETSSVDQLRDQINQRFGKNAIKAASELQAQKVNMTPVIAFNFNANSKKKNTL